MRLELGDCLDKLKELEDNSVDSIVTDPPYGISFMSAKWDYDVPSTDIWIECLRVLKPGGHLLSFSGSRTYHRMAVRIEDAGFEIRDQIMWVYGSGFPKSHNIGKSVDKLQGKDVPVHKGFNVAGQGIGLNENKNLRSDHPEYIKPNYDNEWEGWGTALKPAHEPIVMARKPLSEKSVAENVLRWGTGGLNIDESRIGYNDDKPTPTTTTRDDGNSWNKDYQRTEDWEPNNTGRWPANIIFDEEAGQVLDQQSGISKSTPDKRTTKTPTGEMFGTGKITSHNDKGGASRYFLNVKVDTEDFFMYIYNTLNELLCGNILENQQVVTTLSGVIKEVEKCIVKQGQYTIGSLSMDQFQKDTISIISTLTELMTELKIYNSLQRVNTDFYTQELGKTINKLMELNTENVSVVETINHLMDLTLEMVEHIKVIVKNVEELNYKNGGKQIGKDTINITGNIEKGNSFFYCPKASKKDRDEGLDGFENKSGSEITGRKEGSAGLVMEDDKQNPFAGKSSPINKNHHPTVKPTELMLYLIKLVTPVGGIVMDPFMGSGSTGKGAVRGGFDFIGIEKEEEYIKIAEARIKNEIK
jgi:site-specific DNA-methyltransferase (adenine-specific)